MHKVKHLSWVHTVGISTYLSSKYQHKMSKHRHTHTHTHTHTHIYIYRERERDPNSNFVLLIRVIRHLLEIQSIRKIILSRGLRPQITQAIFHLSKFREYGNLKFPYYLNIITFHRRPILSIHECLNRRTQWILIVPSYLIYNIIPDNIPFTSMDPSPIKVNTFISRVPMSRPNVNAIESKEKRS
jgi:hypothetical protein